MIQWNQTTTTDENPIGMGNHVQRPVDGMRMCAVVVVEETEAITSKCAGV